jgi:hypothetical protein
MGVGGERAQAGGAERVEVAQAFGAVEVGCFVWGEEEGVFCVGGEVGPPAWGVGAGRWVRGGCVGRGGGIDDDGERVEEEARVVSVVECGA